MTALIVTPTEAPAASAADVDRLRIAVGVNDTVIRHLFTIGLDLHTTRAIAPDALRSRLDLTILELDRTIRELRSLIFDLGPHAATDRVDGIEQ